METVAIWAAAEALLFVIAFVVALVVSWRVVLVAGGVITLGSALVVAVGARGGGGAWDLSPVQAFAIALIIGFILYWGWALGVYAATWARSSWAARRG
jgi:hypothetical protein